MLILGRRIGEKIVIGEGANRVVITLCSIDRNQVKIGIECDRGIPVYREELLPVRKEGEKS